MLTAHGVGPSLALGLLSTLTAERLVRAIREKDVATLQSVPRVGRKKAEQMILDLADKLDDSTAPTDGGTPRVAGTGVDDAIRALVSLGYTTADAEKAVRAALDGGPFPAGLNAARKRHGTGGGTGYPATAARAVSSAQEAIAEKSKREGRAPPIRFAPAETRAALTLKRFHILIKEISVV